MTLQRVRQHDLNEMARVLSDPAQTKATDHPSRRVERLGDQAGGIPECDDKKGRDEQVRMVVECLAARPRCGWVKPIRSTPSIPRKKRRRGSGARTKISASSWMPGLDEPIAIPLIHVPNGFNGRIGHRVADRRQFDRCPSQIGVDRCRLGISFFVGRGGSLPGTWSALPLPTGVETRTGALSAGRESDPCGQVWPVSRWTGSSFKRLPAHEEAARPRLLPLRRASRPC